MILIQTTFKNYKEHDFNINGTIYDLNESNTTIESLNFDFVEPKETYEEVELFDGMLFILNYNQVTNLSNFSKNI